MAQDLVQNNLSLLLDCQLLIFPMEHGTGLGTFFHSLRFQNRSFFEISKSQKHFKKYNKKQKTKNEI